MSQSVCRIGCILCFPQCVAGVACGYIHTCGIRQDGVVVCWGTGTVGDTSVPADLLFIQLAAEQGNTCGLLHDGSLRCFGMFFALPYGATGHVEENIAPLGAFVSIAISIRWAACLKAMPQEWGTFKLGWARITDVL